MRRIKEKKKITSTVKTSQMSKKWQYLTSIEVSFLSQNLQNDRVTPRL